MTATYLVTGAAGFIGSQVAQRLLESGANVTGIDNMNASYDVRLKDLRLAGLDSDPGFRFLPTDLRDADGMREIFSTGIDAVFNLAARAGVRESLSDPVGYFDTNLAGALNLLQLCREFDVPKFVQASTSSVYGATDTRQFHEALPIGRPTSPYAASKAAAEAVCYTYHHLFGLSVTVFRYFTVYGPAGRPEMSMFRFIQWISEGMPVTVYGDGTESRDYTYVDDIARGTVAGLDVPGFEIINLGSDAPVRVSDVIGMIEGLTGKAATIEYEPSHPADVPATWADISKARRLMGWRPSTNIEDGAARATEWYAENQDWARTVPTRE